MKEVISRIILFLEALVLCLPLTYLFIFKLIPAEVYFLVESPFNPPLIKILISILILSGLFSGWRLIISFVFFGHEQFLKLSIAWWLVTGLVAFLSMVLFIHTTFATELHPSSFNSLGWGIFFVVPYIHMLFERFCSSCTNKLSNLNSAENTLLR